MSQASEAARQPRRRIGREQRRRQLIRVAEVAFAENGLKGTTIDGIARAAGVDRALVYRHFGSKQALYEACVADALDELRTVIGERWTDISALDRPAATRLGLTIFYELLEERPSAWELIFESALSTRSSSESMQMVEWVTAILEQSNAGLSRHEVEVIAVAMLTSSWGVSRWWQQYQKITRDEVVEYQARIFERLTDPLFEGQSTS